VVDLPEDLCPERIPEYTKNTDFRPFYATIEIQRANFWHLSLGVQ
jgi:hypothetical protein